MNKNSQILIRISDREKSEVKEKAQSLEMSVSEYIMMLIRKDTGR